MKDTEQIRKEYSKSINVVGRHNTHDLSCRVWWGPEYADQCNCTLPERQELDPYPDVD